MVKQCCAALLALVLAISFSSFALAQDAAKKEMKEMSKDHMMKMEKMGPMKSFSCDPSCGFMVKSHDEKEVMSAATKHVKKHHPEMKMTDKQVKEMMKTEEDPGMKKE